MKGKKKKSKLEYIVKEKHFFIPEVKEPQSKEYSNPAFEVGDEGGNTTTPVPGTEDEAEKTNEPPANKEKRGSGGGFNLLKPSNSDTFLALARRASNASRGSDEEDGANGVGERGLKSTESSGSLKLPEQERSVPIPGAGRRSSLADIAITLHTQSRGFFEGGILYAAGDPRRTKHMFIHPYGNRNPEEDEDDDFENLLNLRKRKPTNIQPQNPSALFVWIVVAWFMMGIGFVIVFGAETAGSSTYFKKLFGLIPKTENTGGETA